jgi:peptidoglycan/LPS O-acetylase OafA/YrhL
MAQDDREVVASIQALRAAAVVFVVLNHFFPGHLPGGYIGVDVFFVVSGFLISSHLLKELQSGRLDFSRFYLRRARRLLPTSLFVLALTALGFFFLLPTTWQPANLDDVAAAAIYGVNWRLAANAVNYFADTGILSPVNHYWSLSVEEQFYVVWPALMYICLRLAIAKTRRAAESLIPIVIGTLMAVILTLSLLAAILAIRHDPSSAYFVTYARAWEFAAGGLASPMLFDLRKRLGTGWIKPSFLAAWGVLLAESRFLSPTSGVPGLAALPVVFATAIILVIGDDHGSILSRRIIAFRPIQWLGNISYSLYLWHWPLLILAPLALGVIKLNTAVRFILIGSSLVLSGITKRHIEDRFRFVRPRADKQRLPNALALSFYLLMSAMVAGCAYIAAETLHRNSEQVAYQLYGLSQNAGPCFGAHATEPGAHCPESHRLINRDFILGNWQSTVIMPNGRSCQNPLGNSDLDPCEFGAPEKATKKYFALLGDSHAGVWESALATFAVRQGIRVRTYLASSCPVSADDRSLGSYMAPQYRDACRKWRSAAVKAIMNDSQIDTVVISDLSYQQKILGPTGEWMEDDGLGVAEILKNFRAAGKRVVVIDDIPVLPFQLPECLARARTNNDPCTVEESQVPASTPLGRGVALLPPGQVDYLNFKDVFCDGAVCHTVIGGIPAYMDTNHITPAISVTLGSRVEKLILRSREGQQ